MRLNFKKKDTTKKAYPKQVVKEQKKVVKEQVNKRK